MPDVPKHESIEKSQTTLKDLNEAFVKSGDFIRLSPEEKVRALPEFAKKLSNHIQRASVFVRLLENTEWNTPELAKEARDLKKEINAARTRLRYILKQELQPNFQKSLQNLKNELPRAKAEHAQGKSLNLVRLLEKFAYLEIAQKITQPSLYASAMKTVFNADIESNPEEVKDYFVHVDYSTLQMYLTADALTRYRNILESGETTKEMILARDEVIELESRLAS